MKFKWRSFLKIFIYLFIYLAALGIFVAMCEIFVAAYEIFSCSLQTLSCGIRTLSCGMWDLVPWAGIEPRPPALGAWSLSHCTTREVAKLRSFFNLSICSCTIIFLSLSFFFNFVKKSFWCPWVDLFLGPLNQVEYCFPRYTYFSVLF